MPSSYFTYLSASQREEFKNRVFTLLADYGMKLDPHPQMLSVLASAGLQVESASGMVKFPRAALESLLGQAPRTFTLAARNPAKALPLPRPDGTFYARTCTGAHGWIDPQSGGYAKVTLARLADWARLINQLDEISFPAYLYPDDAPVQAADVYALATVLKNTDKHVWVQPYSAASVTPLIELGAAAAGGRQALAQNPAISMIACSLTPRAFKHMDLEIILQAAQAGVPIHACSLPGAGGTAPATMLGTALLAVAEILAMVAMAQAVKAGAPVVACPIIFSTDMATGRSLQASVESMRGASLADQVLKREFALPTHNYGSGADSPLPDAQSMSERAMVTTWMAASGLDILGGAGQLEVATAVSPLQVIVDNEILGMARRLLAAYTIDEDQLGWAPLTRIEPGMHYMDSKHTLSHCRDALRPQNFIRSSREKWEQDGSRDLMQRVKDKYQALMAKDHVGAAPRELAQELDRIVAASEKALGV